MQAPLLPPDEAMRLASLYSMRLMAIGHEEMFDRIIRLATRILGVPLARVSLLEHEAQWFKSQCGLDLVHATHDDVFCAPALLADAPLIIPDALQDTRFADYLAGAGQPCIRAFASVPLRAIDGMRLGSLCVADHEPRQFSAEELGVLLDLARSAEELLQQRQFAVAAASCMQPARMPEGDPEHGPCKSGLESELRRALAQQQFVLHYQPKVDLKSGHITGLEALIRWEHPDRGMVSPGEFIPLAEETGYIVQLGEWVLAEACRQIRRWQDQGLPQTPVAVNLSSKQFLSPNVVSTVKRALEAAGIGAGHLEIELTESASMSNPDVSACHMRELRELGVSISIDDFGTGFSSLSYLKKLPIDKIKIDRSFVSDIAQSEESLTIVQAVIAMAHRMHRKVVAEGVETEKQLAFLSINRCDEMQGYFFSKPLAVDACTELLKSGTRLQVHQPTQAIINTLFGGR